MSFDYLPETTIKLRQIDGMFKINTDTHLLGKYMKIKEGESVLDIGTNNGALLLYASLQHPSELCGIDIHKEAITCASENLHMNQVNAELFTGKVQDFTHDHFDVIVVNPPYFKSSENSHKNENAYLKAARHEEYLTLEELFASFKRLLKSNGRVYMVHRAQRIMEIHETALEQGMKVKSFTLVYDENKELATSVLLELVFGKNDTVTIERPIWIKR